MARRVLLVDPDLDALGELSAALRGNGFTVHLADNIASGIERAKQTKPDVILVSDALCQPPELAEHLRRDPELAGVAALVLVNGQGGGDLPLGYAPRGVLDQLMAKIVAAPPRSVAVEASQGEVRGDLSQVPLIDLLQLLSMNRRTGILSVTTAVGAGEVRIAEGDVIDAVYRRLEGEKALYRLVGEREGSFAFVPGGTVALRRITIGTAMLVMDAMRQLDEGARLRVELAPGGDALIAAELPAENASKIEREVMQLLQTPHSVDEVLDEVQAPDLEVLQAMRTLSLRGVLRKIPRAALVTRLASDDRLQMLRALVTRLAREGFGGAPRVAIAALPHRLASLAAAILRIEDAIPPFDASPLAPVPHLLATLRFGETVELNVMGLPIVGKFAPLWALALPSMGAVVRLDSTDCPEFDAACAAAEIPVLHAAALLGEVEEGDPAQVAALLRVTLETAAGS
ncbi:MAG TPA: response regulator [Polyangiaceae bacterium]|nr:response regulator [Polyangiaceae bacterium]